MTDYKPGTCNINRLERKKRLVIGAVGFLNSAILTAIIALITKFELLYIPIFILNFVGFLGILQYKNSFCAGLALKKKSKTGDEEEKVSGPDKISKDRRKSFLIILESGIFAFLTTSVFYIVLSNL